MPASPDGKKRKSAPVRALPPPRRTEDDPPLPALGPHSSLPHLPLRVFSVFRGSLPRGTSLSRGTVLKGADQEIGDPRPPALLLGAHLRHLRTVRRVPPRGLAPRVQRVGEEINLDGACIEPSPDRRRDEPQEVCGGVLRALESHRSPPDASKHHLRKNHANIPGGGRRMRTELGKRKLEGVSQQLHCPHLSCAHLRNLRTVRPRHAMSMHCNKELAGLERRGERGFSTAPLSVFILSFVTVQIETAI